MSRPIVKYLLSSDGKVLEGNDILSKNSVECKEKYFVSFSKCRISRTYNVNSSSCCILILMGIIM